MAGKKERHDEQTEPESDGIKVTDRRLFTSEGELRRGVRDDDEPDAAEVARTEQTPSTGAAEPVRQRVEAPEQGGSKGTAGFERRPLDEPEGVDFTFLINAMAQPALIYLGEVPHPGSGKKEVNLEQARLNIDLLDLLRIKCRGNLTTEEEGLLDRILYQLRMLYVARSG